MYNKTGNRQQATGNRQQATGNRQQATGNRQQATLCLLLLIIINPINAEDVFLLTKSAKGININCHSFGYGNNCIIVIGGIHGRYEENTVSMAERLIDYCRENENRLNTTVKIIPNLNPDGFLYEADDPILKINGSVIRFNGNSVDLNRNWDTPNWQTDCIYSQNDLRKGAGGTNPMSENEVIGLSNFIINCKSEFKKIFVITIHSYVVNKQIMVSIQSFRFGVLRRRKAPVDACTGGGSTPGKEGI
jgi:hypothetical protein